jgi:hypothetical protein
MRGVVMNKLDKLVENKIKADGWIKLLPTEKCQTSQPHRFRYTDGKTMSVSIISEGTLLGVYQGPYWQEKYKKVDWDTPECNCMECSVRLSAEETMSIAISAAMLAKRIEYLDSNQTVDIVNLHVERAENNYTEVSFSYKIPDTEESTKTS